MPRTQSAPSSRWGRNSEPITPPTVRYTAKAKPSTAIPTVTKRWSIAYFTALRYLVFKNSITGLRHSRAPLGRRRLASTGAISMENSNAPSKANATVQAIGLNRRPSTRCSVNIGRYAVMMMAIA